jgi:hypothetical protein
MSGYFLTLFVLKRGIVSSYDYRTGGGVCLFCSVLSISSCFWEWTRVVSYW